eukprot:717760-Alexandrium_andersonii.AAC.1
MTADSLGPDLLAQSLDEQHVRVIGSAPRLVHALQPAPWATAALQRVAAQRLGPPRTLNPHSVTRA